LTNARLAAIGHVEPVPSDLAAMGSGVSRLNGVGASVGASEPAASAAAIAAPSVPPAARGESIGSTACSPCSGRFRHAAASGRAAHRAAESVPGNWPVEVARYPESSVGRSHSSSDDRNRIGSAAKENPAERGNRKPSRSRSLEEQELTQVQAARILGIDQPKISALIRGRFGDFSLQRLFRFHFDATATQPTSASRGHIKTLPQPSFGILDHRIEMEVALSVKNCSEIGRSAQASAEERE